ncbi:MFS transporter [Sphingobium indicum]|uniref:MFS transporter n=1 Tax=Sphingobium indicum TaxID=332055 RepID=UPI0012DEABF8
MAPHTLGLVVQPLSHEFGWSRTQITAVITLGALIAIPFSPVVGALFDRFGTRYLALPGIVLAGLGCAGISLANGSTTQWFILWGFFWIAESSIKVIIWTAAVMAAFNAARSMALSITLCGVAFSSVVVPPLMRLLVDNIGWREGYVILAAIWSVPTFLLCYFFLGESRGRQKSVEVKIADAHEPLAAGELPGMTMKEAARSLALWRVGISTSIMMAIASCFIVHIVPLITEMGVNRSDAALLASLYGIAGVVGKLVTGWMMERIDGGLIGALTNAATAIALIFLLDPFRTEMVIVAALIIVGYSNGTKLQICVYLTGSLAGLRNYGKIFGTISSAIALASGLGVLLGGMIYDSFGSYQAMVIAFIPASLLAAALIFRINTSR